MNILHLNTYIHKHNLSFPHYQFHKLLLQDGHKSILLVAKGDVAEEEIVILNRGSVIPYFGISRVSRKVLFEIMLGKYKGHYYYPEWNLDLISSRQIIEKLQSKPDIIITYWTKFAFNQKLLYELSQVTNAPILCVLTDMAPLTGGCHYAYDCERYKFQCGKCPALKSNNEWDLSRYTWEFKRKYIEKTNITLLACSSTSSSQADQSSLFKNKRIERLNLGIVDENIFRCEEKEMIRQELGIPQGRKVIFFGAASLTESRKGMSYLLEALNILSNNIDKTFLKEKVFILIAGANLVNLDIPFHYKYLGYLNTQEKLAKAYQASDLFVCPSIEDAGPIMVNQSIMCGRPVVSFDVGVAQDLVFSGITGYRAKTKESKDLAYGLQLILQLDENRWQEMSNNCRKLGLDLFSLSKQSNRLNKIIMNVANGIE